MNYFSHFVAKRNFRAIFSVLVSMVISTKPAPEPCKLDALSAWRTHIGISGHKFKELGLEVLGSVGGSSFGGSIISSSLYVNVAIKSATTCLLIEVRGL